MAYIDDDWLHKIMQRGARGDGWVRVNCPVCSERTGKQDKRASFGISVVDGWWHCFKCNVAGRLSGYEDHDSPRRRDTTAPTGIAPPEGYIPLGIGPGKTAIVFRRAREYLAERNILTSTVKSAMIGSSQEGPCRNRVIVPFLTATEGVWSGWVARDITGDRQRKYLNATGMQRAKLLYNHNCLHEQTDVPVFVVEGVFDALACNGNGVALLGKPSDTQVEALVSATRPIAVVLDGDAWREGWALARRLRLEGVRAGFVKLPARTDPDEVGWDWLLDEARKCINAPL